MELTILIPCLNEVITIKKAIKSAQDAGKKFLHNDFEVIVADNGSTDGTLTKLSIINNIRVVHVPIKGYGAALHYGILSARSPYILFADADLSYDFHEVFKFLPFIEDNYDLILGSRFKGEILKGAMPFLNRYFGTPFLTLLIKILYKIKCSDCNSGMRVVKKSFYKKLNMKSSGMEWASELLIKGSQNYAKYIEVPIIFKRDQRGKKPNLQRWQDGWKHLKIIILLKPTLLITIALLFLLTGILFLPFSLFTTVAMFLVAQFFLLSFLLVKQLEFAITRVKNNSTSIIEKLPLLLLSIIINLFGFISLFYISDNHLFTKYIILSQIFMFNLWLFFIETIKTHLINPLPTKVHAA